MSWDHVFSVWGMLVTGVVGMTLFALVDSLARHWRKAREVEIEAALKSEMIKQGRSADEIEQILKAPTRGRATAKVD